MTPQDIVFLTIIIIMINITDVVIGYESI